MRLRLGTSVLGLRSVSALACGSLRVIRGGLGVYQLVLGTSLGTFV